MERIEQVIDSSFLSSLPHETPESSSDVAVADTQAPSEPQINVVVSDPDTEPEPAQETAKETAAPVAQGTQADDLDEELKGYSEKVKKRIKRMTWQTHEAQRQQAAAMLREQEALKHANTVREQYEQLRAQLASTQKMSLQAATGRTESDLRSAKAELQQAHELQQFDRVADLTDKVARLSSQHQALSTMPAPDVRYIPEAPAAPQAAPVLVERATRWMNENPWFAVGQGQNGMPVPANPMSTYALAVDGYLRQHGFAEGSEQYYEAIDSEMKKRFPEAFGRMDTAASAASTTTTPAMKRTPSAVAPVIRQSAGGRTTVTITPSQRDLARKLNLTVEQYAEQVAKESREQNNGY